MVPIKLKGMVFGSKKAILNKPQPVRRKPVASAFWDLTPNRRPETRRIGFFLAQRQYVELPPQQQVPNDSCGNRRKDQPEISKLGISEAPHEPKGDSRKLVVYVRNMFYKRGQRRKDKNDKQKFFYIVFPPSQGIVIPSLAMIKALLFPTQSLLYLKLHCYIADTPLNSV